MPTTGPATLNTFVAPIFPLPWDLISIPLYSLAKMYPNGIEPIRKETTQKRISLLIIGNSLQSLLECQLNLFLQIYFLNLEDRITL